MAKLYILHTAELGDPREHEEWKKQLSLKRWEKAVRFPQAEDRKNSAGAGLLLCYAFRKEGIPFFPDSIYYGKYGKPFHKDLHFNLSHSGEYAVCAVGRREIGCDIQKRRPCRPSMVRRFFSEEEQKYILSAKGKEQERRFITLWCRKESYLKKTGEGLTKELREVSCLTDRDFYEIYLEGYIISLCMDQTIEKKDMGCEENDETFYTMPDKKILSEYVKMKEIFIGIGCR